MEPLITGELLSSKSNRRHKPKRLSEKEMKKIIITRLRFSKDIGICLQSTIDKISQSKISSKTNLEEFKNYFAKTATLLRNLQRLLRKPRGNLLLSYILPKVHY
jgi:hypothetical protein